MNPAPLLIWVPLGVVGFVLALFVIWILLGFLGLGALSRLRRRAPEE